MEKIGIQFLDYPEDEFADYYEFDNKQLASEWFNKRYSEYKKNDAKIEIFKENWPSDEVIFKEPLVKGYRIEMGDIIVWVRIFKV